MHCTHSRGASALNQRLENLWILNGRKWLPTKARRIAFNGTLNCRDLGGLPLGDGKRTATGKVYRSGRLSNLTPEDHALFVGLGVRQIFDFRMDFERERFPNVLPDACDASQRACGYLPDGAMDMFGAVNDGTISPETALSEMGQQYERMALEHCDVHAQLFERMLADGSTPFLFHCSGGKDRTGIASALLLSIAGVERQVIVADYLLTNLDTPQLGVLGPEVRPELVAIVGRAHAVLIETALDAVERKFTTYKDFVCVGLGLSEAQFDALRALLIEP